MDIRPGFERSFKRFDKESRERILRAVVELSASEDPMKLGEPLAGRWRNCLKYRVGDYRIIYAVSREGHAIVLLETGHRRQVC